MNVPAALNFTYEDYCLLPEDRHYEVIDGEPLLTPAPTPSHQDPVLRLARQLADFVQTRAPGRLYVSPCDVVLSKFDVLQPDVFFIASDRASLMGDKYISGAPDLVVEVLSPSTADRDRTAKAKRYVTLGVREMRLVDPEAKSIEVLVNAGDGFRRDGLYDEAGMVRSTVLEGFGLAVGSFFQPT